MILLDTSVWIDHIRRREEQAEVLLKRRQVLVHPFVTGELALGPMPRYDLFIQSLSELPQATVALDSEVLFFIKRHSLMGSGIGYVDAHLLTSVQLQPGGRLWTRNKRLAKVAMALGVGYEA
ncbi:type II toxin-antitoxin system VapC family toxin [Rhizobium puerariae]|uniref:Type II toxin-antitoxin system VapC family toxin n=1 Tax=Rhizobium puerariae TaxID=1585791 RepID=A0ABV6AL00_9HYPH